MFVDIGGVGSASNARLEDEITTLAGHLNAATARFLLLVSEYDRREAWKVWGSKSCADWLSWRCGISPVAAREQLRVARALGDLPAIREEFEAGRLSYSQVRALTRVATPGMESPLLELARYCTAAQLDRLLRGYRKAAEQLEEARVAHERASCSGGKTVGCWSSRRVCRSPRGRYCLRRSDRSATGLASTPPQTPSTTRESPRTGTPRARWMIARKRAAPPRRGRPAMIPRKRATPPRRSPRSTRPPPRRLRRLTRRPWPMRSLRWEETRSPVARPAPASAAPSSSSTSMPRRSPPTRPGGVRPPAGIRYALRPRGAWHATRAWWPSAAAKGGRCRSGAGGARSRPHPPAIQARDRGCRFPGCNRRHYLHGHHIEHWAHGGETSEENLVLLCHYHHTLVHEGGYSIRRHAIGRLSFHRPDGKRIAHPPHRPSGSPGRLALANRRAGLDIDPDTAVTGWQGDHLDLPLATHLLCETRLRL